MCCVVTRNESRMELQTGKCRSSHSLQLHHCVCTQSNGLLTTSSMSLATTRSSPKRVRSTHSAHNKTPHSSHRAGGTSKSSPKSLLADGDELDGMDGHADKTVYETAGIVDRLDKLKSRLETELSKVCLPLSSALPLPPLPSLPPSPFSSPHSPHSPHSLLSTLLLCFAYPRLLLSSSHSLSHPLILSSSSPSLPLSCSPPSPCSFHHCRRQASLVGFPNVRDPLRRRRFTSTPSLSLFLFYPLLIFHSFLSLSSLLLSLFISHLFLRYLNQNKIPWICGHCKKGPLLTPPHHSPPQTYQITYHQIISQITFKIIIFQT